jgi:hypothetical protein
MMPNFWGYPNKISANFPYFSRDFVGMINWDAHSPTRQVEPDEQRDLRPGCWDLRGGLCRHACGAAWWQGMGYQSFHGDLVISWGFNGGFMVIS